MFGPAPFSASGDGSCWVRISEGGIGEVPGLEPAAFLVRESRPIVGATEVA